MIDNKIVNQYYKETILSLAIGMDDNVLIDIMNKSAEDNEFSKAQGIKEGITDWLSKEDQYCNAKPLNLMDYVDEYGSDETPEDDG